MEWYALDGDIKPKIDKIYLVDICYGTTYSTAMGKFNGDYWELADESDEWDWNPNDTDCNWRIVAFADIPNFRKNNLTNPQKGRLQLISVKTKGKKKRQVMLGRFNGSCWVAGNMERACEIYPDEIDDIKIFDYDF